MLKENTRWKTKNPTQIFIFVVRKNCSYLNTLDVKMMRMEMMIAQSEAREVSPVLLSCELTTDVRWPGPGSIGQPCPA